MAWREASFDGKKVWVEVGADGQPAVAGQRVAIRYSASAGAKIYRGGAAKIRIEPASVAADLPEGVAADSVAKTEAKTTFGKAGTRTADQAARAAADATQRIADLPENAAVAYTDGAAKGNPGRAGSGAHVRLPDGRVGEASLSLGTATNNVAELTAIGLALDLLDAVVWTGEVALFTDSKYAHGVLALGWKVNANQELVGELKQRLRAHPRVRLQWMAGHVGIAGNERADALANRAVTGVSRTEWLDSKASAT